MAGEEAEIICLDSSEDEKEKQETSQDPPGKVLFHKFVSTCSPLIADVKKRATMIGLMEKRFNQARETFQESEEFANILTAHITELETKQKDAFKHILDVVNVLKSNTTAALKKKKISKSKHTTRENERTSKLRQQEGENRSGSDTDKSRTGQLREVTSGSERESTAPESDSYTQLKEEHRNENATLDQSVSEVDTTGQEKNDSSSVSETTKTDAVEIDEKGVEEANEKVVAVADISVEKAASCEEQDNEKDTRVQSDNNEQVNEEDVRLESVNNDSDHANTNSNHHQIHIVPKPIKKKKKVTHRQIRKYERLLHKLSTEIKKLSEKELTLEEMDDEDSTHILEYQLRKRATKVYEKLCELKEVQPKTGRVSERRIKFQGTRYPEINKKLEKLANLPDYFPDFQDVYILITKVNDKKNLRLERKRMHNIAKDAFEMIGKKLQQRRQEDFLANFSSHPTLDFVEARDPADFDLELQMKLKNNWSVGSEKLYHVTKTYTKRQETNEEMGVDMEVASANSASEASDDDGDAQGPKKKKRRIDLITVVDDDEDDHGGDGESRHGDESQTGTEDDTGDEGTFQSAWADDEEDESDRDEKEDDDDDGADDFGALSPLTDDDEDEPIEIIGEENEDVKSPAPTPPPEEDDHKHDSDSHSDINAANSIPPDATVNIDSSSDTNMSATKSIDSSPRPTPKSVSLNNGLSNNHDSITAGTPVKTKPNDVPNGDHNGEKSDASAQAGQVVVSSSSPLPIILNVMSLRHERDTATDDDHQPTAPDPGIAEESKQPSLSAADSPSQSSGKSLEKLPLHDPTIQPADPAHSPCSSPKVSSSRSPSRSRRRNTGDTPEEITILSSDPDSDILLTSEEEATGAAVYRTNRSVGPHIPLTRISPDLSRSSNSGPQGSMSSESRRQSSTVRTSTPRVTHDTVCWQHRHFGPAAKPRTRGVVEVVSLSDSSD